jgi:ElaB/YqjD/DUF883 family membrane-anchored ribosome-binding protein
MAAGETGSNKLEDAIGQIGKLREQVDTLLREQVQPAVGAAVKEAEARAHDAAASVASQVRAQPLLALAIAAGIGFLLGRVSR